MLKNNTKLSVGFLFDDTLDSNDGVAQYVKVLGKWLVDHGHQVTYLVGETKMRSWAGGQVYSMAKNQRVSFNGNRLSIPLPAKRRRIKQVLAENTFDVLHVQVPYSPFMSQKVIKASADNVAIVGTFHVFPAGRLARFGSVFLRVMYAASLQRVTPMLAVSDAASDFAKQSFGLQTKVLPNVVELDRFKDQAPRNNKSPRIVFLGRLVERKGCRQLLSAFKLLHEAMPEVRLVIAGDGPLRPKLERFVQKNKLKDSVEFLGFIDENDKPKILAGADVACFPSLYGESFGIVLIEAMAAGAGVVLGGDNPGYRSILGAQPNLLFNPGDADQLASKLRTMLTNKKLAGKLHDWQQMEVKKYDVNNVGPRIVAVYIQAIAKIRPKGDN